MRPSSSSVACWSEAGVARQRVIGVGVGLPSPIDRATGTVGSPTILPSWTGLRPAEELAKRLEMPVDIENDANLGARAEQAFGAGRGIDDFVYVSLRAGIGGGLVFGGRLLRARRGLPVRSVTSPSRPTASSAAAATVAASRPLPPRALLVEALSGARGGDISVAELIQLVRDGDFAASRLVHDAGRAVGRALADLCSELNPAAVIVGGDLAAADAPLFAGIRESIDRFAVPPAAQAVQVVRGVLGERAELLGALALVIGTQHVCALSGWSPSGPDSPTRPPAVPRPQQATALEPSVPPPTKEE